MSNFCLSLSISVSLASKQINENALKKRVQALGSFHNVVEIELLYLQSRLNFFPVELISGWLTKSHSVQSFGTWHKEKKKEGGGG